MARDIGPNCAVPAMRAGGAVDEPLPSTWIRTFGYILGNASPHSVMRLFMVSEPTLLSVPDTPLARWYAGMAGSTLTTSAPAATPAGRAPPSTRTANRFLA